ALLVAQLALSFVLVICAGLMVRSLLKLAQVDPGFRTENVLTMSLDLNWTRYMDANRRPDRVKIGGFYRELMEPLRSRADVTAVAVGWAFPLNSTWHNDGSFAIEGRPSETGQTPPRAEFRGVDHDYFRTLRIPVVAGRGFEPADDALEAPPVAVVNRALPRR